MSIRDNRYKDQKLRLLRCGFKKLIYLAYSYHLVVPNKSSTEYAQVPNPTQRSTYTALVLLEGFWGFERLIRLISCFTTEIHEGFDVQRTTGLLDTLRKYGYLTQAITRYYREKVCNDTVKRSGTCPSFDEFIGKCEDLEKVTVGDIFGIQFMQ
ncbi:hypothetical protein MKW98_008981, partial [Papaver atlanticum]